MRLPYKVFQANEGSRDCGAFFLDVVGAFRPQDVTLKQTGAPRLVNPEIEQFIEQVWIKETALAASSERKIYNGQLVRLAECDVQGNQMTLTVGATSYKEFLGTNVANSALRYLHGMEVLANPIGTSAAVVSSDGFIVLGRRSEKVTGYPGMIHPIGGMVETVGQADEIDIFASIRKELHEEAGISQEVGRILCLGLVRDKQLCQPEFIFDVEADADMRTIRQLAAKAADAFEHQELLAVRNQPASVVTFIEQHRQQCTPLALAVLLLHGLHHWGSGWFTATRGHLRNVI
ncbi:MAG: hypothetical protein WC869_04365 [Phycisphaerae bacterium]|jgi:hypothetical protein